MKVIWLNLTLITALVASIPALAWGDNCEYSKEIEREVSLSDFNEVVVVAGAGELKIKGDKRRKTALISAKLCAQEESKLKSMGVLSGLESNALRIETEFSKNKLEGQRNSKAYIDLSIYLPASAELDVTDSSGQAYVDGIKTLTMVDSSGSLTIEDVAGDVRVKDSSGSLSIGSVVGSVWVTDSSGGIDVRDVLGDFTVEVDSSGVIEADNIKGDVLVRSDSSGSIYVTDVGGAFTVGRDSSGEIKYKNVSGEVRLPN